MKRSAIAVLLALAPLTTGFYPSCQKHTIGAYPNWPNVSAGGLFPEHHRRVGTAATEAEIKGTVLYTHWGQTLNGRALYDGSCQRSNANIAAAITPYLDEWVAKRSSGGRELNLQIVVPVHLPRAGGFDVGPACKGYSHASYATASFRNEFIAFVDAIGDTVSLPKYQDAAGGTGVQVLLTIGNEVDLYLRGDTRAWNDWNAFVSAVRGPIQDNWTGLKPSIASSVTWLSPSNSPYVGTWDPYRRTWTSLFWVILDLFNRTDAIAVTYYPIDGDRGALALDPRRPATDLANMAAFARAVGSRRGLSHLPVYLQEVGYPTDPALHVNLGDPLYSGGVTTNGETNQVTFVTSFFDAWYANRTEIRGAAWWTFLDWAATPTEPLCTGAWGTGGLNYAFCSMGLFDYGPGPTFTTVEKPAWRTFRDRARAVQNW